MFGFIGMKTQFVDGPCTSIDVVELIHHLVREIDSFKIDAKLMGIEAATPHKKLPVELGLRYDGLRGYHRSFLRWQSITRMK